MNQIEIESNIAYQVNEPTTFLLQINVEKNDYQKVINEVLQIEPATPAEECLIGPMNNRVTRVHAQPGLLTIVYRALVEMQQREAAAADVNEVQFEHLPAEVLPYLNSSRYCESDELANISVQNFG